MMRKHCVDVIFCKTVMHFINRKGRLGVMDICKKFDCAGRCIKRQKLATSGTVVSSFYKTQKEMIEILKRPGCISSPAVVTVLSKDQSTFSR